MNHTYLLCRASGDRAELASYMFLKVTRDLMERIRHLGAEVENLDARYTGRHTIIERGELWFDVITDLPSRAKWASWVNDIEAWDFDEGSMELVPDGEADDAEIRAFVDACSHRGVELTGMRVWRDRVHLECYPKEATYTIESSDDLWGDIESAAGALEEIEKGQA